MGGINIIDRWSHHQRWVELTIIIIKETHHLRYNRKYNN